MNGKFSCLAAHELKRAREKHPKPLNSKHEAYAVLLEEVEELRDEVFWPRGGSDEAFLSELVQVAAMAQRMAEDLEITPRFAN